MSFLKRKINRSFEQFLEVEVLNDLEFATKIINLQPTDISQYTLDLENIKFNFLTKLRERYQPDSPCPYKGFKKVKKSLQEEYNNLHNQICSVLYPT
ncbi:hypothetical protein CL617_02150 [archaeon]|nr:hypothetical protein [archaeon]|tara:strand:- start:5335 stop:5625 length:291 start_codon:yes stop_codon:yes gene_type:complete